MDVRADDPTRRTDDWHARPVEDVLAAHDVSSAGLTSAEAAARLARHGANRLPAPKPRGPVARLLGQIDNLLIWLLLASAAVAWALGHLVDAGVIVGVVVVNAVVGFVQEGKAEAALGAIRDMVAPRASVLRDGKRAGIDAADVVPGDVVLLEPGDRVPADLRLTRQRTLAIDEAALTGESVPVGKEVTPADPAAPLAERRSMAYSGTLVTRGQGAGIAVATGASTELGRIGRLVGVVEPLTTPLLRKIDGFARRLSIVVVATAVAVFAVAVWARGMDWAEALMAVVGMAVAAIPEGLPAVITITLAVGVRRMAARRAIIRRLPAVETLGATTVICSDKTGTLTRNEMMVVRLVTLAGEIEVEGTGYAPFGAFRTQGRPLVPAALPVPAATLVHAGLLCNDARLAERAGGWHVEGDPMEGALVALAMKAGLAPESEHRAAPRLTEIPFDAAHRTMATVHRMADGGLVAFVKGAPEAVLALCATQMDAGGGEGPLTPDGWHAAVADTAAHGERLLAFALKRLAAPVDDFGHSHLGGAIFVGLAGFIDPPRAEAVSAVAECRAAGISVKMITGDHAATAAAVARALGLAAAPEIVTGADLDATADADLPALAARVTVFARTSPEHKLRLVRALQAGGAVVAMTGDGVNDAPALKQADVGVAMGRKGTEAAKEASEMVLADDDFASIVAAVREGRTVYDNVRKVIAWTLPTNGGEAMVVVAAILLGLTLPLTAAQILWINMLTTVTLGLVLAFEPPEPGVMERPPRAPSTPLLSAFLVWRVVFVSALVMLGAFAAFALGEWRGHDLATARTMTVGAIVVLEAFYLFNVRYLGTPSITWRGVVGTPVILAALAAAGAAQLAFTYLPVMNRAFASAPIPLADGLAVLGLGVVLLLVLELEKRVIRRLGLFRAEGF